MAAPNTQATNLDVNANIGKYHVTFPVTLATLNDAAQFTIVPGHKGRILSMDYYAHTPATTAAKLSTLTPSIGGVNVTGGVIALTTASADTRNEKTPGTAITANNSFSATDTITITASATTAFVEGNGKIDVVLVNDDTREALARALGGLRTGT